jgi:hypothetical protein
MAEAAILLAAARLLVARVPLHRWSASLGRAGPAGKAPAAPLPAAKSLRARRAARAVERCAGLLPFETKCLPRAMALSWMLRRRHIPARVVMGVAEATRRGTLDDLHAWVTCDGEIIMGKLEQIHHPIINFSSD